MKRNTTLLTAVVFGGLVMQAGLVSAEGNRNNGSNESNKTQLSQQGVKVAKVNKSIKNLTQTSSSTEKGQNGQSGSDLTKLGTGRPKLVASVEAWKKFGDGFGPGNSKHDENCPANIGPDRPDGRVEVPMSESGATLLFPTAGSQATLMFPSQGPQGYVWNNGHWERPKANGTSVNTSGAPVNAMVQVNDQRPVKVRGDNVVPPPVGSSNNGVTVTNSPVHVLTGATIYGVGPGPSNLFGLIRGFESTPSRDHRTPEKSTK